MKYFPIFINLKNKCIVVVGGGEVALRKVKDLINTGAFIKLISPHFHEDFQKLDSQNIQYIQREYQEGDLEGAILAFSTTNDPIINKRVYAEAEQRKILINAVDDPELCHFIVPSFFYRGDLIVAVSTSATSPSIAAKLRRQIESAIPENIEEILEAMKAARDIMQKDSTFSHLTPSQRGNILKTIAGDDKMLSQLIIHYKSNSLKEYLKSFHT